MPENSTEPLPMVPPTDRPAMEDPLLIQELAAEKRAGVVLLMWVAACVVGVVVLHLVLDSPFTGATLLIYALPLLVIAGSMINAIAKLSVVRRHHRRLGTGVWRWIPPERLRFRGRTVAFDLDGGKQGQGRLFSNGVAELSRRYGVWVIPDQRGGVWMRTAGSTLRLQVFVGEQELPGEHGEPDGKRVGWMAPTVFSLAVLLIELGLLWLALDGPVQAFGEQPATVIVLALLAADTLYGIPAAVKANRRREPEQWHEVPISVTGIGFRRPWSTRYTVHGTGTLPNGTTVPVQLPDTHMGIVASISATGKLWVADPPTPSSKSITGLPGLLVGSHVWFGEP
jgi:hypothetical protein